MNFFLDNMMSPRLAEILDILFFDHRRRVRHIRTEGRFEADTPDTVWVGVLCEDAEPWGIISGDRRMLASPDILAKLHGSNNVFFCMDHAWCSGNTNHSQAWKLVKVWPEIMAHAASGGPRFFEISTTGNPKVSESRFSKRVGGRQRP